MPQLVIEKLTVKPTRIVCDLRVVDERGVRTSLTASDPCTQTNSQLINALLVRYPTLLHHACVNDEGDTFAAVADHTSLPHLLEHLVIALQVESEITNSAGNNTGGDSLRCGEDARSVPGGAPGFAPGVIARSGAVSPTTYVGTTEWTDRSCARARVEVNFRDDLVALRSFSEAVALINDLLLVN